MSNLTFEETTTKEKTLYYKRIDDLIDDAEIEAEIEAEKKIRSKNTKLLTISFVAVAIVAFLYFGTETTRQTSIPPMEEILPEVAQTPVTKPSTVRELPTASPVIPPVEPPRVKPEKIKPVAKSQLIKDPSPSKPPVQKIPAVAKTAKVEPTKSVKPTPPPVQVNKTPQPPASAKIAPGNYIIQTGAFSVKGNAERMVKRLKAKGFDSSVVSQSKAVTFHVVYLYGYPDEAILSTAIQSVKNAGIKNPEKTKNADGTYSLNLGKFRTANEAQIVRDKLSLNGIIADEKVTSGRLVTHIAQVGGYATRKDALKVQKDLASAGFKGSFIRNKS
jgi:cell division protein FtsN